MKTLKVPCSFMEEAQRLIPLLRPDGTLPQGIHQATIDEVIAAYPPVNQQRHILNDSLRRAIEELWYLDPSLTVYLDSSYITSKAEPNDVDLLIISARYTVPKLLAYLDHACPVEAVSLDVNVEPQNPNLVLTLFTMTRTGQDKGIIQII